MSVALQSAVEPSVSVPLGELLAVVREYIEAGRLDAADRLYLLALRREPGDARGATGLVYDPTGRLVLDPDEQVQQALRLVFDTFERVGSALGVVQYFAENQLSFPTRHYGGSRDGQLASPCRDSGPAARQALACRQAIHAWVCAPRAGAGRALAPGPARQEPA